jgi:hypothetical protein
MTTTIKLKNGTGVPTAGALVQGEPAFDLTNKRLYTENAGGTVIEVGTNPSTLSVTGAATVGGTLSSGGIITTGNTSAAAASAGDGRLFPNNAYGAFVYGQGTTYDVALGQRTTGVALGVLAGTTNVVIPTGNLLVGKTATAFGTAGIEASASNGLWSTRSGLPALALNRLSTDGSIADFYKDGVAVGSIGAKDGDLTIGTGDTGLYFSDGGDSVYPYNPSTQADRDAAVDLGYPTVRFKDLFLSGGVYLGGTGAANLLDDYEEGSFTPSFTASTTAPTIAYNTQTASYTKIGNTVTYTIFIVTNSRSGGSGNLSVTGLPFTVAAGQDYGVTIGFNYNWETGDNPLYALAQGSTTGIVLYKSVNNEHNEPADIVASGNSYLRLTGFYYTTG